MGESQGQLHPAEAATRQRTLLLKIVHATFAVLVTTFTALQIIRGLEASRAGTEPTSLGLPSSTWVISAAALLLVAFVLTADRLTRHQKISTITGTMLGVLAGLLATLALGGLMDLLLESWVPDQEAYRYIRPIALSVKVIMGICLSYLGVITVLKTQDDFRLVIPYVEFSKQIRGVRPVLVDSSALIDGRIADIAATNFLQAPLVVPRFVVNELQLLADSTDSLKRAKGRRGLDMITRLQRLGTVDLTIDDVFVAGKSVDQMLVDAARSMQAMILTTDVALARIASIHNVRVLNINDLANAARMSLVPGESLTLRLLKPGEQQGQGVGYLPDGTMVVAEDGGSRIGETVTMTVTSSLQTSAGRLIFARIGQDGGIQHAGAHEAAVHHPDSPPNPGPQPDPSGARALADFSATPQPPSHDPIRQRGPYPPKPPASMKTGTPRNPRR